MNTEKFNNDKAGVEPALFFWLGKKVAIRIEINEIFTQNKMNVSHINSYFIVPN